MEGFMVNTTNVNNCANDIQGYGGRIKDLQDSVRSIRLGMRHKLSSKEDIDRTLRRIEDRMLEEAALMSSLDQALAHIAEAYRRTERGLVTEGIRRSAGGQAVTEQQQAMMDQYMQAAIFEIRQEDQFSQEAWENASVEERKEILNRFLDRMEQEMGISLGDIQFRSGEDLGYNGAYNYADNYIALNEAILNSGDPSGAMTTLMHEARHAYQHAACENPEQFLVTADTIQGWQDSADNYKGYLQGGKYSDISSEIDAHNFAGQEMKGGYVLLTSGMGDGPEMYDSFPKFKTRTIFGWGIETVDGSFDKLEQDLEKMPDGSIKRGIETESGLSQYNQVKKDLGEFFDEYDESGEDFTTEEGKRVLNKGWKNLSKDTTESQLKIAWKTDWRNLQNSALGYMFRNIREGFGYMAKDVFDIFR